MVFKWIQWGQLLPSIKSLTPEASSNLETSIPWILGWHLTKGVACIAKVVATPTYLIQCVPVGLVYQARPSLTFMLGERWSSLIEYCRPSLRVFKLEGLAGLCPPIREGCSINNTSRSWKNKLMLHIKLKLDDLISRGGRPWHHILMTTSELWWHSKGKDTSYKDGPMVYVTMGTQDFNLAGRSKLIITTRRLILPVIGLALDES